MSYKSPSKLEIATEHGGGGRQSGYDVFAQALVANNNGVVTPKLGGLGATHPKGNNDDLDKELIIEEDEAEDRQTPHKNVLTRGRNTGRKRGDHSRKKVK
jgi:hypothetical protein